MAAVHDFVMAGHAAELAVLRMAALAVYIRTAADDVNIATLRLVVTEEGSEISVDLLDCSGREVGGFSL